MAKTIFIHIYSIDLQVNRHLLLGTRLEQLNGFGQELVIIYQCLLFERRRLTCALTWFDGNRKSLRGLLF